MHKNPMSADLMTLLNPLKRPLASPSSFVGPFFGRNPQMQQIRRNLDLLANTDLSVLLQGESGTGKDVVAELLHQQNENRGELVRLNCSAPLDMFADLRDAAGEDDGGVLNLRSSLRGGGTLLLDGVHELDSESQAKLLLFLKENDAGGRSEWTVTRLRIVSTTSGDLQELAEAGHFRSDLLYRINAVKLALPPLRQRTEDIPGLIAYFLKKFSKEAMRPVQSVSAEMLQVMERYHWPGNIRQLANLIRNFVLVGSEEVIAREFMDTEKRHSAPPSVDHIDLTQPIALKEITRQFTLDLERQIILRVLQANGWNRQKTAKWLQISYRSLLYKLSDSDAAQTREQGVEPIAGEHDSNLPNL